MNQIYLSVVLPAYNEETNIRLGAVDKVLLYLEKQKYSWELLVIDDGSDDQTADLVREIVLNNKSVKIIKNPHQGKAATVISGILSAKGKYVLFSDLDQATPIKEVEKLLPWFEKGADVVIGSRNSIRTGAPLTRKIMAKGFMILRSLVLGLTGITDTQCGFKAFKKEVAVKIFDRLHLYGKAQSVKGSMVTAGFDIESLYVAKLMGYSIKEVPVEWHYVETRRVSPIKDSLQGIIDIFAIKINTVKGVYK